MEVQTSLKGCYADLAAQLPEVLGCPYDKSEREAFTREGVVPVLDPNSKVKSHFSPVELKFLNIVFTQLSSFARGRDLADPQRDVTPLSERIISAFEHNDGIPLPSFGRVVGRRYIGLYEEFDTHYPYFRPVVERLLYVDGTTSFITVVDSTAQLLDQAIKGNLDATVKAKMHRENFVRRKDPEFWCPGEALAKVVIQQAAHAARVLSESEMIRQTYNPMPDTSGYAMRREKLDRYIYGLVDKIYKA